MNEKITSIKTEFTDARGFIANILEVPITHVAIITSRKGSVRANHYHPKQVQYCFVIQGGFESTSLDLKKKGAKKQRVKVRAGDLVTTPPMIAHAMKFTEDTIFLNLTTGHRESKKFGQHTIPYVLLP